jgi:hypothetical protein
LCLQQKRQNQEASARPATQSDHRQDHARAKLLARRSLPHPRQSKARQRTLREKLIAETIRFSSLIKPTDNWDFAVVHYPRIDDDPGVHGYIPGDPYANCLFYFARHGGLVAAPMAGGGQIMRVYEDLAVWTKGLSQPADIELSMADLTPRGPYAALISQWDLRSSFPHRTRPRLRHHRPALPRHLPRPVL